MFVSVCASAVHIITCAILNILCCSSSLMSMPHISRPPSLSPPQAKHDAQSKLRQAQLDLQQSQESVEEEQESKGELQKQLAAAKSEAATWKGKLEGEAQPRIEELEEAK